MTKILKKMHSPRNLQEPVAFQQVGLQSTSSYLSQRKLKHHYSVTDQILKEDRSMSFRLRERSEVSIGKGSSFLKTVE